MYIKNIMLRNCENSGVLIESSQEVTLQNCTITTNLIGITSFNSAPTIIYSKIYENGLSELEGDGAGVALHGSNADIENCEIFENLAASGAGIFVNSSSLSSYSNVFTNNSASLGGGILFVNSSLLVSGCTISEHKCFLAPYCF